MFLGTAREKSGKDYYLEQYEELGFSTKKLDESDPLCVDVKELLVHVLRCTTKNQTECDLLQSLTEEKLMEAFEENYDSNMDFLAKVHEEIKLRNIPMTTNAETFVQKHLLDYHFFINKSDYKNTKTTLDEVKNRLSELRNLIEEFLCFHTINDRYAIIGKYIAKHIRVLKRYLQKTYFIIPWEEIEFCLVVHLSIFLKPHESDLAYAFVLTQNRMVKHLRIFESELSKLQGELSSSHLGKTQIQKRQKCIENITHNNPEFEELYKDFAVVKDIYSLKRIYSYLAEVLWAGFDADCESGKLAIQRTLQVMGECLKSSSTSPHISDSLRQSLNSIVPYDLLDTLNNVRNSISHAEYLMSKINLESKLGFGSGLQDDLKKVENEIIYFLYKKKMDSLQLFISNEEDSFYNILMLLGRFNLVQDISVECSYREVENTVELLEQLEKSIGEKDDYLNTAFKEIRGFIDLYKSRGITQRDRYVLLMLQCFNKLLNPKTSDTNKKNVRIPSWELEKTDELLGYIVSKSIDIEKYLQASNTSTNLHEIETICSNIRYNQFVVHNTKRVSYFKDRLGQDSFTQFLQEIGRMLEPGTERQEFKEKIKNAKDTNKIKISLLNMLNEKEIDAKEFAALLTKLPSIKQRQKIMTNFKENEINKCKEKIKMIDDPYGIFLKNSKWKQGVENFFKALNLTGVFKKIWNKAALKHYENRLRSLENIYKNKSRAAIEMLLLDLMELLIINDFCTENYDCIEEYSPILVGKTLRNYLAHGDPLVDILETNTNISIICNVLKLLEEGKELFTNQTYLIGMTRVPDYKEHFEKNMSIVKQMEDTVAAIEVQEKICTGIQKHIADALNAKSRSLFFGSTALHVAVEKNNTSAFEILLKEIPIGAVDTEGLTPADSAINRGHVNILESIMEHEENPRTFINKQELLHMAAKLGNKEIIELFCTNGADVNLPDSKGHTPPHIALARGQISSLQVLLKYGADMNIKDFYEHTLLHYAAKSGSEVTIDEFLQNGIDINSQDRNLRTALHEAIVHKNTNAAILLIDREADINLQDKNGLTPLHCAALLNLNDVIEKLLQKGATPHIQDNNGNTALHLAIIKEDTQKVQFEETAFSDNVSSTVKILLKHININSTNSKNMTALHLAAAEGNILATKLLLGYKETDVVHADERGWTALHWAANKNHTEVLLELIQSAKFKKVPFHSFVNGNIGDSKRISQTPLELAASGGHEKIVEALLDNGADLSSLHCAILSQSVPVVNLILEKLKETEKVSEFVNAPDVNGETPLHVAAICNNKNLVETLLNEGANIDHRDRKGSTALHAAVRKGHNLVVETLINKNADLTIKDNFDKAAIHIAIQHNKLNIVKKLLSTKNYATIANIEGPEKVSPLSIAARRGFGAIVQLLLDKDADFLKQDDYSVSPLYSAGISGNHAVLSLILKKLKEKLGNSMTEFVNAQDRKGWTLLMQAAFFGHYDIVEILLSNGANIKHSSSDGTTALHTAARNGHESVVQILINSALDVNILGKYGSTPLMVAAQQGNDTVVDLLLNNGAHINHCNAYGQTALHVAAASGHYKVTEMLINKSSDVTIKDNIGNTALHHAIIDNHLSITELLLDKGADILVQNNEGLSALHCAIHSGNVELINLILGKIKQTFPHQHEKITESIDAPDKNGNTPLQWAANCGKDIMVETLLNNGADINHSNTNGHAGLHVATIKGHEKVIQMLINKGADITIKDKLGNPALHYAVSNNRSAELLPGKGADN